jgi:hypothetical protein
VHESKIIWCGWIGWVLAGCWLGTKVLPGHAKLLIYKDKVCFVAGWLGTLLLLPCINLFYFFKKNIKNTKYPANPATKVVFSFRIMGLRWPGRRFVPSHYPANPASLITFRYRNTINI